MAIKATALNSGTSVRRNLRSFDCVTDMSITGRLGFTRRELSGVGSAKRRGSAGVYMCLISCTIACPGNFYT